jgi:hypothetical protein
LHGIGSSWLAHSLGHNPLFSTIFACLAHFYAEDVASISFKILTPVYQTTGTGCYIPEVCNLAFGFVYLIGRNVEQVRYLPAQFVLSSLRNKIIV